MVTERGVGREARAARTDGAIDIRAAIDVLRRAAIAIDAAGLARTRAGETRVSASADAHAVGESAADAC